jgi:hypothetical protein
MMVVLLAIAGSVALGLTGHDVMACAFFVLVVLLLL